MAAPTGALNTQIVTLLSDLSTFVQTRQATYLAGHGRYWQGVRTPLVVPADGATATVDLTRRPTDQTETWGDFGVTFPGPIPVSVQIDVYNGPGGHGYTVTVVIRMSTETWRRTFNVGPEPWRASGGWVQL